MKKLFLILTIGVFAGFLSSCATVMRENSQSIPIKANVDKVDIKLVDRMVRQYLKDKHQQQLISRPLLADISILRNIL